MGPFNTILYSQNSKTTIIPSVVSPNIRPNESCALLLFNEIFPFEQHQLLSQEIVWVARNSDNFFVALKTKEDKFTLVARGNLYDMNFDKDLENIWKVYNLKGFEKFLVTLLYFLTIPYVKYFECISPFLGKMFHKLKDCAWRDCTNMNVKNFFTLILSRIMWLSVCYIHTTLEFYLFMFPFYAMGYFTTSNSTDDASGLFFFSVTLSIGYSPFLYDLNICSINIFDMFINTIKNDLSGNYFPENISKRILTYKVEPQNTMWALPFMVLRQVKVCDLRFLLFFYCSTSFVNFLFRYSSL